jgi:hypothetical protein
MVDPASGVIRGVEEFEVITVGRDIAVDESYGCVGGVEFFC